MPAGRPPALSQLIPDPQRPGHKIRLNRAILRTMRDTGFSARRAANCYGIERSTTWRWLNTGRKATQRLADGHTLTVPEDRCRRFFIDSLTAHADWMRQQQELHDRIAQGGLSKTTTVLEVDPSQTEVGPDGQARPKVLKRSVKTETTLPDLRALEWQMERLARSGDPERHDTDVAVDDYAARVEVTGADGGPVQVSSVADDALRLAEEARAFAQGARAQQELDNEREKTDG